MMCIWALRRASLACIWMIPRRDRLACLMPMLVLMLMLMMLIPMQTGLVVLLYLLCFFFSFVLFVTIIGEIIVMMNLLMIAMLLLLCWPLRLCVWSMTWCYVDEHAADLCCVAMYSMSMYLLMCQIDNNEFSRCLLAWCCYS